MPLPIAPIAGVALRYGAIALATYAVTRRAQSAPRDQRAEDAMDDVAEGVAMRKEQGQVNGAGRFRRVIRLGADGPGIEVDATALTRIRIRKLGD